MTDFIKFHKIIDRPVVAALNVFWKIAGGELPFGAVIVQAFAADTFFIASRVTAVAVFDIPFFIGAIDHQPVPLPERDALWLDKCQTLTARNKKWWRRLDLNQ